MRRRDTASASGDGLVDATFNAIHAIFAHEAKLVLFSIGAVTEGNNAQARITLRPGEGGKMADGQGPIPIRSSQWSKRICAR
jgi:2-isopropylmalate synthase